MKLIQLVFALLATAHPAPSAVNAVLPPAQPEEQVAISVSLADWEHVLYVELADSPVYAGELVAAIKSAAVETSIAPEVLWSVAYTESHGRHYNGGGKVKRGSSGEVGLMQIKPFWKKALQREYGISVDLYSMPDNVRAGAYILSRGGDEINTMLSYYNTGKQLRGCGYQRKVCNYLGRLDELADAKPALGHAGLASSAFAAKDPAHLGELLETSTTAGITPRLNPAQDDAVLEEAPQDTPASPQQGESGTPKAPKTSSPKAHYDPHQDVSWAE